MAENGVVVDVPVRGDCIRAGGEGQEHAAHLAVVVEHAGHGVRFPPLDAAREQAGTCVEPERDGAPLRRRGLDHAGAGAAFLAVADRAERGRRALEHRRARQFIVADVADLLDGRAAPLAKRGQHLRRIGRAVAALLGERVSVERDEQRPGFLTRAAEADLVAIDLDVSQVAGLFEGGEHISPGTPSQLSGFQLV
jgi:hypothetical protein